MVTNVLNRRALKANKTRSDNFNANTMYEKNSESRLSGLIKANSLIRREKNVFAVYTVFPVVFVLLESEKINEIVK